jgi:hypothetical protein
MRIRIPETLEAEHDELHAQLAVAMEAGGKTGAAAQSVAGLLHAHFLREEEFALPPLGLLARLVGGRLKGDTGRVIALSGRLKSELPQMRREHRAIVAALGRLTAAAKKEKKPEVARFAERLAHHAKTEEQVLYPAAILVGEYLKLMLRVHMPE